MGGQPIKDAFAITGLACNGGGTKPTQQPTQQPTQRPATQAPTTRPQTPAPTLAPFQTLAETSTLDAMITKSTAVVMEQAGPTGIVNTAPIHVATANKLPRHHPALTNTLDALSILNTVMQVEDGKIGLRSIVLRRASTVNFCNYYV